MPRQPVGCKQYLEGLLLGFQVDGSAVTTSTGVNTGLLAGQHLATIKKGTAADSNLVTITLNRPLGLTTPIVLFTPITADCECRLETTPTTTVIQVRTTKSSNLATGVDDADFNMLIFGTEGIYEGSY